jgi:hypothetical protein
METTMTTERAASSRLRHPAPLPTMICPERPVAVDREDRRSETRKTQDCRPVGNYGPAPAGHYAVLPQIAIHARPARSQLPDLAKFAKRYCSRGSTALKALARLYSRVSVQSADLCSEARQRVGSADGGHWRDLRKPGVRPEATRSVTAGLRAISASSAVCGEGDLPLPQPLKGAIVLSKTPGIWRMSADPITPQTRGDERRDRG